MQVGMLLRKILPEEYNIQEGIYSLVGATAALAGVFRSSISLIVIIIEGELGVAYSQLAVCLCQVYGWRVGDTSTE